MQGNQVTNTVIGKPRAFIEFFAFLALLGIAIAVAPWWIDAGIMLVSGVLFVIGSLIAGWQIWLAYKYPQRYPHGFVVSQVSVLPRQWRRWVLGESPDSSVRK